MPDRWPDNEPIDVLVERVRVESGRSQYALADDLRRVSGNPSVDHGYVYRWETRRRIPTPYWREHLSVALDIPRAVLDRAAAVAKRQRTSSRTTDPSSDGIRGPALTPATSVPRITNIPDEVDQERLGAAMAHPGRVDAATVDALAAVLAGQRRLEDALGAAALLDPVTRQQAIVEDLLRAARGPHRDELGRVVTDWTTFTGWLHAAMRRDDRALELFARAEEMADELNYGAGAALATSFRGYVARQQGRPRAVIRAAGAALATPGAHRTQRAYDTLQAAQGYAELGDRERVRRLLDDAAGLADAAGEPPAAVYWYTKPFFRMNIGMAELGIGEYRDAAEMLSSGLAGMPSEHRGAEWAREYEEALSEAKDRA